MVVVVVGAQMAPVHVQRFAEVGLNYSLGGLTGNTLDSHRLAAHAYKEGGPALQNALMEVHCSYRCCYCCGLYFSTTA